MIMRNGRKKKIRVFRALLLLRNVRYDIYNRQKSLEKNHVVLLLYAQYKWKMIFVHIYTYWTADNSVFTPVLIKFDIQK